MNERYNLWSWPLKTRYDHVAQIEKTDDSKPIPTLLLDSNVHPKIVNVARQYGVHAVVWYGGGWGKDDNSHFPFALSEALATCDPPIKFIGPSSSSSSSPLWTMLMDTIQSTLVAQSVGIPCLSWNGEGICNAIYDREIGVVSMDSYNDSARIRSLEEAKNVAVKIGFPVRIMASTAMGRCFVKEGAISGEEGVRIVSKAEDVEDAYQKVREEVSGDENIVIMRELSDNTRHIEVQILADEYGNVVSLNGCDCSIQRNNQVIVEEAPPTIVPAHVWKEMEASAVLLAKEVGFVSAGTVEFLYMENDQKYYFLQFTPYLTIGHSVTERITNVNLPSCQLQIAMGIELGNISDIRELYGIRLHEEYSPMEVSTNAVDFNTMKQNLPNGHCIAVYLTIEGDENGPSPCVDDVTELDFSSTDNVRGYIFVKDFNVNVEKGNLKMIHLLASGNDREEARRNATISLNELCSKFDGTAKTKYVLDVMEHDDYVSNRIDTKWLERCDIHFNDNCEAEVTVETNPPSINNDPSLSNHVKAVIGAIIVAYEKIILGEKHQKNDVTANAENKSQSVMEHTVELILDKIKYKLYCRRMEPNRFSVSVSGSPEKHVMANIIKDAKGGYTVDVGGKSRCAFVKSMGDGLSSLNIMIDGIDVSFSPEFEIVFFKTEFAGTVINILVDDGAHLNQGECICEIDTMNESKILTTKRAGFISWKISKGYTLKEGDIVATMKPDCPQESAVTSVFHGDLDIDGWCVDSQHNSSQMPYFTFKNPFESFNSGLSGYSLMSQNTFNTAFDDLKKVVATPILPEPDYDADEPPLVSTVQTEANNKQSSKVPSSPRKEPNAADSKKKANRNSAVNHDKCLAQLRQLEKEFNAQISEKDVLISEMMQANDDLRRQVDELTLESDGLNQTIQAGKERLSEVDKKDEEIHNLKALLSEAQQELATTNESYSTLKSRVKSVATELKERRTECRSLSTTVQELTLTKSTLESEVNDYQVRISKLEILMEDKNNKIESLHSNVTELRSVLKEKEKELAEKAIVSEKALDSYKKKAQSSLAHANARIAAANQAKEDAEIAATNAMTVSTTALNQAKEVEERSNAVMSKAQEKENHFLAQINEYRSLYENVKEELSQVKESLKIAEEERSRACNIRDDMFEELSSNQQEVERQQATCLDLEQELQLQRVKTQELEEELRYLKEELDSYASAAFKSRQTENVTQTQNKDNGPNNNNSNNVHFSSSETDGAMVILQQELQVANDVIKELKEALGALLSQNPSTIEPKQIIQDLKMDGSPQRSSQLHTTHLSRHETTTESTPLFFAFEKQAELNTARDEITRLAALLGDAESAKVEAFEAMDEMRKKMEEAEARLRRYEKLASATNTRPGAPHSTSSMNIALGSRRITGPSSLSASASTRQVGPAPVSQPHSDSTVNLEYLKNIILRFMKATSLNEKRALVPVISAVLELTVDEQESAVQNLEKSANVTGVGVSLIENIQNKGFHGLFS
mmetsp:Transcript_7808/g.14709  ORF Transcript_7808/g.14709 Transcript_7808/m.14709 type:complete len:1495 (+) Transcript_7808:333-4817(+)